MTVIDDKARDALDQMFSSSFGKSGDDELVVTLKAIVRGEDDIEIPEEFLAEPKKDTELDEEELDEEGGNLHALINDMSIPQKIKLALFGNKLARGLLIRDPNRQVSLVVLQNGGLTEGEVVDFARNSNLDEQIHRRIAGNSTWMKNYEMKIAVVTNPKVPIDISMKYVKFLNDRDLKKLSRSKNVPGAIATQCRKMSEKRSK